MLTPLEVLGLIIASIAIGASIAVLGLQFLDDCLTDYEKWRKRNNGKC